MTSYIHITYFNLLTHLSPPVTMPAGTGHLLEGDTAVSSCQTYLSTIVTASVGHCADGQGR